VTGARAHALRAEDAARRVAGASTWPTTSRCAYRSAGCTDTEIAQAVRTALERDVLVPDTRIQSTVANGHVTQTGTVDSWSMSATISPRIRISSSQAGAS
jgi:osmotically-inducible protein OsmY